MSPFIGLRVENDSKREQSLMDVRDCVLTKWFHLFSWSFLLILMKMIIIITIPAKSASFFFVFSSVCFFKSQSTAR